MIKKYEIEVDCANCANLMEEEAKKTEGVKSAVVNFLTQKLTIEFVDDANEKEVMKRLVRNCKKIEDEIEIYY